LSARRYILVAGLTLLFAPGCKKGDGAVLVNVSAQPPLPQTVAALQVTITIGANTRQYEQKLDDAPASIPPARSFGIVASQDLGDTVIVKVQAIDAAKLPVGPSGEGSAPLRGGSQSTLDLVLGVSALDGGTDAATDGGADASTCNGTPGAPPKNLAPMSGSYVSSQRPTLKFDPAPGTTDAVVELCKDRACTQVIALIPSTGTAQPATSLMPGVVFWRVRACNGGPVTSATWQFHVGARSAPSSTVYGVQFDANGDGIGDLAVGAPCAPLMAAVCGPGRVYVYSGAAMGFSGSAVPKVITGNEGSDVGFGRAVAGAGDINGDGFGDLAVGIPKASPTGKPAGGKVAVYLGSATGISTTAFATLDAPDDAGSGFGMSVSSAGDLDGDGFGDLIIGAPLADSLPAPDGGRAYVFRGGLTGMVFAQTLSGERTNDYFGTAVIGACDFNGDGRPDVVVGAPQALSDQASGDNGAAYVYLGGASGLIAGPIRREPGLNMVFNGFGRALACGGDIDGDGLTDLVIGHRDNSRFAYTAGVIHLGYGGATNPLGSLTSFGARATPSASSFFGSAVGLGDFDGDGFSDAFGLGGNEHRIYFGVIGGVSTTSQRVFDFTGSYQPVGGSADVNGDGLTDVIMGFADSGNGGQVLVHFGSNTALSTTPSATFDAPDGANTMFGSSATGGPPSHPY
jgi:hypothetical protein